MLTDFPDRSKQLNQAKRIQEQTKKFQLKNKDRFPKLKKHILQLQTFTPKHQVVKNHVAYLVPNSGRNMFSKKPGFKNWEAQNKMLNIQGRSETKMNGFYQIRTKKKNSQLDSFYDQSMSSNSHINKNSIRFTQNDSQSNKSPTNQAKLNGSKNISPISTSKFGHKSSKNQKPSSSETSKNLPTSNGNENSIQMDLDSSLTSNDNTFRKSIGSRKFRKGKTPKRKRKKRLMLPNLNSRSRLSRGFSSVKNRNFVFQLQDQSNFIQEEHSIAEGSKLKNSTKIEQISNYKSEYDLQSDRSIDTQVVVRNGQDLYPMNKRGRKMYKMFRKTQLKLNELKKRNFQHEKKKKIRSDKGSPHSFKGSVGSPNRLKSKISNMIRRKSAAKDKLKALFNYSDPKVKKFKDEYMDNCITYVVNSPEFDKFDKNKLMDTLSTQNTTVHKQLLQTLNRKINPHIELRSRSVQLKRNAWHMARVDLDSSFDKFKPRKVILDSSFNVNYPRQPPPYKKKRVRSMSNGKKYQPFDSKKKNELAWKLKANLRRSNLKIQGGHFFVQQKGARIKADNQEFIQKLNHLKLLNMELSNLEGQRREEYLEKMRKYLDKNDTFVELRGLCDMVQVWQMQKGMIDKDGNDKGSSGDQTNVFGIQQDEECEKAVQGDSLIEEETPTN